jgi:hypothetical protein
MSVPFFRSHFQSVDARTDHQLRDPQTQVLQQRGWAFVGIDQRTPVILCRRHGKNVGACKAIAASPSPGKSKIGSPEAQEINRAVRHGTHCGGTKGREVYKGLFVY